MSSSDGRSESHNRRTSRKRAGTAADSSGGAIARAPAGAKGAAALVDDAAPAKNIDDLQIGAKLRHARKIQGLRLIDLAKTIGCSESLLSKVENEQVRPSLKILHRLASELHTSIGALFAGASDDDRIVMRRAERPVIRTSAIGRPDSAGVHLECLIPDPANRLLYGSIHIVEPGGESGGFIEHKGEEVGYVLEGELELIVDGTSYHLYPGDSFFFDSNLPHGYRNPGRVTTRVVWVNTPSTF
jgi:transcriptional regulator with XRE-family HTH domain